MGPRELPLRLAAIALASSMLVGCGGDDKPAVCSSVDALKTSVEDLKNVEVSPSGLTKLQADLTQVRSDLSQVKTDAKEQYAGQIDAVDQAATSLSSGLSAAAGSPSVSTLASVGADIQSLSSALTALGAAVKDTC